MNNTVREPKQKRAIQNKALLHAAAKNLFTTKGYFATSSNEIVKEAGVSIGTFYAYYSDKKAIFMAIIEEYFNDYNEKLNAALDSIQTVGDSRTYIKNIILATMDISRLYSGFENEFIYMKYTDDDIKLSSKAHDQYIISRIKEMLVRIDVHNKDVDITAFLFFCLVDNFSHNILKQDDLDVDKAVDECVTMILIYTNR